MSVILVVGRMGSGKTTYLKENFLLKTKRKKKVYAVIKQDIPEIQCETDFRKMIEESETETNTLYLIDEAVSAIPKKRPDPTNPKKIFDKKLINWFINSRKCNNFIVLVFHGLEDIPTWLLKYVKRMARFATNDQMNFQATRFSSFYPLVKSIQENVITENFEFDDIQINS